MRRSTRSAAPARSAWWCGPRWTRSAATVPRCSRGPEPTSPRAGGFGGPSRGPPFNQSIENDPAVHVERLPGDVARAGGGEEDGERGDVLGIVGASEGNTGVA